MANLGVDESVFLDHIKGGPFQSGVARERWRLISIHWPYAVISVSASPRPNAPSEYALRFNLQNYPQSAPTARPWDTDLNAPLADNKRPHGVSRVSMAFRTDWKNGIALYLPCDREAIEGHDPWRTQHPAMIWDQNEGITLYLRIVHELLNSSDYTGTRSS
ncbi:MAG: hypothetical protein ACLPP9_09660 [Smithella sp.]